MSGNSSNYELEISLIEIVRELISRRKMILLMGIVGMVLVCSLYYIKQKRNLQMENEKPLSAEEYIELRDLYRSSLDSYELAIADATIKRVEHLHALIDYIDNAQLFHIDPYNVRRITLRYKIVSDELSKQEMYEMYSSYIQSDQFLNEYAERIGIDATTTYLERVVVNANTEPTNDEVELCDESQGLISVVFLLTEGIDETDVINACNMLMQNYVEGLEERICLGSVEFVGSVSETKYDSLVEEKQTNLLTRIGVETSAIEKTCKGFDADTTKYFDYSLMALGLGRNGATVKLDDSNGYDDSKEGAEDGMPLVINQSEFSLDTVALTKRLIIGFALGTLVYVAFLSVIWIIVPRVGIADIVIDGAIVKKIGTANENSLKNLTAAIAWKLRMNDVDRITLVLVDDKANESKKMNKIIETIQESLEKCEHIKEVNVVVLPIKKGSENELYSIMDLVFPASVILCIKNRTKLDDICRVANVLYEKKSIVLGTVECNY